MAKRILIIKLGYSETLDNGQSLTTSLGDVLRTTVILHFFKRDEVWWLVDRQAEDLLQGNRFIKKIVVYTPGTVKTLLQERFDTVVNLEKIPEVFSLCSRLKAKEYFGFAAVKQDKRIVSYVPQGERLVAISSCTAKRRANKDCWQKVLAQALGRRWRREPYILGYKPRSKIKFDIGFNWTTSQKWANKSWPKEYWLRLQRLLEGNYSVSWQEGLKSLKHYMDWINSCRLIVTADTLGLHLALALQKKVIALFGPTPRSEIYFYNLGSYLTPGVTYPCIPCLKVRCGRKTNCMYSIKPEAVAGKVKGILRYG